MKVHPGMLMKTKVGTKRHFGSGHNHGLGDTQTSDLPSSFELVLASVRGRRIPDEGCRRAPRPRASRKPRTCKKMGVDQPTSGRRNSTDQSDTN